MKPKTIFSRFFTSFSKVGRVSLCGALFSVVSPVKEQANK
jgi:hypothetical protein